MIATFEQALGYDTEMDKDEMGLIQWVWTVFDIGTTRHKTVSSYRPSVPTSLKKQSIVFEVGKKVYEQQHRYYQKKGYRNCDLIYNFDTNLLAFLSLWRM